MATNCDVLRYDERKKTYRNAKYPDGSLAARRVPVRQTDRIPQLMKTKMLSTCLLLRLFFALPVMPERVEAADTPTTRANIYDETADGSKQISDALNIAKREDKRVLLQFGANWCGWCHLLHELFESNRISQR
jgi:thiol:disulfide interchange protein